MTDATVAATPAVTAPAPGPVTAPTAEEAAAHAARVERTIEIPTVMDEHLKAVARTLKVSKAELIRFFTVRGLIDIYEYFDGSADREKVEEVGADIKETAELMPLPAKIPF